MTLRTSRSQASPCEPDLRRLSEVARHVVIPEGITGTLWPRVEARCHQFGDQFDTWQAGLGEVALALRADGTFAASVGGVTMSIPRQVAKSFLTGRICLALATLYPNLTILWTAHHGRTADNAFRNLSGAATRPGVSKYLALGRSGGIFSQNGASEIRFRNGSRIMFGARGRGFGRGFDAVDMVVFDECQILRETTLEAMVPTANQATMPHGALLFFMGTPPRPEDPGEEFAARRGDALTTKPNTRSVHITGDAVYVECSADPDVGQPDGPDLMDWEQIAIANPSYPRRTPRTSILRVRKNLKSDASWRREALGVWDTDGVRYWQVIARADWDRLALDAKEAPSEGGIAWGVKFSTDGERVAVAAAVRPTDGRADHVECLGVAKTDVGTTQLIEWLSVRHRWSGGKKILVDGRAGASDFRNALIAAGVPKRQVSLATVDEALAAHAGFLRAIHDRDFTHGAQPGLDRAAALAVKRKIGTAGGWGWAPAIEDGCVAALDAVTLARHAVLTSNNYSGRGTSA